MEGLVDEILRDVLTQVGGIDWCVTEFIRVSERLLPLATFALETYGDDPCACFMLKGAGAAEGGEAELNMRMHKAISVIQFKVEGQLIRRYPEFGLESRMLLHHIDFLIDDIVTGIRQGYSTISQGIVNIRRKRLKLFDIFFQKKSFLIIQLFYVKVKSG